MLSLVPTKGLVVVFPLLYGYGQISKKKKLLLYEKPGNVFITFEFLTWVWRWWVLLVKKKITLHKRRSEKKKDIIYLKTKSLEKKQTKKTLHCCKYWRLSITKLDRRGFGPTRRPKDHLEQFLLLSRWDPPPETLRYKNCSRYLHKLCVGPVKTGWGGTRSTWTLTDPEAPLPRPPPDSDPPSVTKEAMFDLARPPTTPTRTVDRRWNEHSMFP